MIDTTDSRSANARSSTDRTRLPTVDATISLAEAGETTWDVLVVGAGPAGAVAAHQCARLGAKTLLVDRATFPRPKVCGGCANVRCAALLERIGLGDLFERYGAVPTREVALHANRRSLRLPLSGGYALSRETFDAALIVEAIAAGARFLPGTRVRSTHLADDVRRAELASECESTCVSARIVVAADGLGGRLLEGKAIPPDSSSRLGAGVLVRDDRADIEPGVIYMGGAAHGYVGVVRVEEGLLNVAAAFDPAAAKEQGLGSLAVDVCANAGLSSIEGLLEASWRGTPLLTRRHDAVAGERILAIGDATGYVEPFTGEGMSWAICAAIAVAPVAVSAAREWSGAVPREWRGIHRDLVVRRTWFCRTMTGLLRWPIATRSALAAATMLPAAARLPLRWLDRVPLRS